MGTWGPAIFSNDDAVDLRRDAREILAASATDAEALAKIRTQYADAFADPDDGRTMDIALALVLHKYGRLTPELEARALAAIDAGPDERWDTPKLTAARNNALAKARATLTSPQPARKKVTAPFADATSLTPGDVLAYPTAHGTTLLRVARLGDSFGSSPVVATLAWSGADVPPANELDRLEDRAIANVRYTGRRFRRDATVPASALLYRDRKSEPDFADAGFALVGHVRPRRGDAQLPAPGLYTWAAAAKAIESGEWLEPANAVWDFSDA